MDEPVQRVCQRIDEWKAKLIDQTRRNRLLFFRPTKSSTLQVVEPLPEDVFCHLVLDERDWRFYLPPEMNEGDISEPAEPVPMPPDLPKATELPERASDELLCAGTDFTKVRRTIRNIHRRSRSELQERGVRILYVTFGMLDWRDHPSSDFSRSPVMLVPAEIDRGSARDPFKLSFVDEEVVLNPALEVKLQRDFGFRLPPIPEDWEQTTVRDYLARVAEAVRPLGWKVHEECWIATLSFFKLVMYQDLNGHAALVQQHPVVRALAGEEAVAGDAAAIPDPQRLDEVVPPAESFLVMDADSSQLACIEAVKRGTSLVLQGPPGTGKTQTITNIVAESLAAGRKVLFVSEKMAALEQVYERLQRQQLDPYCLELHSQKANKREVVKELERCLRTALQPGTVMTQFELEQLRDRREQLNRYVRELHAVREPLGRSVFSVLSELASLDGVPFVGAETPNPTALSVAALDQAAQLAQRLARLWKIVAEAEGFPWRGCAVPLHGIQTRAEFQELLGSCGDAISALRDISTKLALVLQLPPPTQPQDANRLLQTGEMLARGPGAEHRWLLRPEVDSLTSTAQRCGRLAAARKELRAGIEQRYDARVLDLPAEMHEHLRGALDAVAATLGASVRTSGEFVAGRQDVVQTIGELRDAVDLWRRDADAITEALGLPRVGDIEDIKRLLRIGELCQSADRPTRTWLVPEQLDRVVGTLPGLKSDHEEWSSKRRAIFRTFEESLLELDLERLSRQYADKYQSFSRWMRPGFYRLRWAARRCHRERKHVPDLLQFLQRGRDIQRLQKKLEDQSPEMAELLGDWYRGYETDFRRVTAAAQTAKELIALVGSPVPNALTALACIGGVLPPDLSTRFQRLRASVSRWEHGLAKVPALLQGNLLPTSRLPFEQTNLDQVRDWASSVREPLTQLVDLLDVVVANVRPGVNRTVEEVLADLQQLARFKALEGDLLKDCIPVRDDFGVRFKGLDTDWDAVVSALEWVRELRPLFGEQQLPTAVQEVAVQGTAAAPDMQPLRQAIRHFQERFAQLGQVHRCTVGRGNQPTERTVVLHGNDPQPFVHPARVVCGHRHARRCAERAPGRTA